MGSKSERIAQANDWREKTQEWREKTEKGLEEVWEYIGHNEQRLEATKRRCDEMYQVTTYVFQGTKSMENIYLQEVESDDGSGWRTVKQLVPQAIVKELAAHFNIKIEDLEKKTAWEGTVATAEGETPAEWTEYRKRDSRGSPEV